MFGGTGLPCHRDHHQHDGPTGAFSRVHRGCLSCGGSSIVRFKSRIRFPQCTGVRLRVLPYRWDRCATISPNATTFIPTQTSAWNSLSWILASGYSREGRSSSDTTSRLRVAALRVYDSCFSIRPNLRFQVREFSMTKVSQKARSGYRRFQHVSADGCIGGRADDPTAL